MLAPIYTVDKAGGSHHTIMVWSITTTYSSDDIWPVKRFELGKLDSNSISMYVLYTRHRDNRTVHSKLRLKLLLNTYLNSTINPKESALLPWPYVMLF